jgi:hypothetical protein
MFLILSHIFNHTWEKVTYAHWNKYPNEFNKSIKSVDILDRKIIGDTIVTTRLLSTCINILPSFLKINATEAYVIETSIVDMRNKKFCLKSENLFLQDILKITESIIYEECDGVTTMVQKFDVSVNTFGKTMFEKHITENIKKNSINGYNAVCHLLKNLG